MYRPLPDSLTIDKSTIEGIGLFAKEFIPKDTNLGVTHIPSPIHLPHWFGIIRTPLGGFINHSETPNCIINKNTEIHYLTTLVDIQPGEELTVKYTMYDPTK